MTSKRRAYPFLLLITVAALFVHGYHPGVEDAEIYTPTIKKILNPTLYPFGTEFFLNHARLTLFDELIATSVRASHVSFDLIVFLWYVLCAFLTLLACWRISCSCFSEPEARWAGVMLVAALFTIPVGGTSLYIADQYLTSRSIVTFAVLFAIWNACEERRAACTGWSIIALCIHPLMAVFGISYAALLWCMKRGERIVTGALSLLPLLALSFADLLPMPSDGYRRAVSTRPYFFILQWKWYEWLGALAPLLLLWLMAQWSRQHALGKVRIMSQALIIYGLFYLVAALTLTIPERLIPLARFQPMRSLHILYILMFLFGGGLLGKLFLRRRVWCWIAAFLPLCCVMYLVQRQLFPASSHIEWPMKTPANEWVRAFDWIRRNTPTGAVFAIDPDYMLKDDGHGFRATAERSRLADAIKDSGAVTMFPELPAADHWLEQVNAQSDWQNFQENDFRRLEQTYGVSWVVLENPVTLGFSCPYHNETLSVCRLH